MTQEVFHLFWNSASKSRGEGKPIYNKEQKNWIFSEVTKIWGKKEEKRGEKNEKKPSMILTRRKKRRKRKLPMKMTVMTPSQRVCQN